MTTLAQEIQNKLDKYKLKCVLFAVQIEVRRYKDIPKEDLPIDVATLMRAASRLANLVHDLAKETLLMHEWEVFGVAVRLELDRFENIPSRFRPKHIVQLDEAIVVIDDMLDASRSQVNR